MKKNDSPIKNPINLSYVVTTRNKMPYLREGIARLLENVQPDEEIVVVDGASTDGTVDYLKCLYDAGKIHQLLSEHDEGEAHGWNKGLLMARGELIKLISDDDVYFYPGIKSCKKFMLEHRAFDLLGTEGADLSCPTPRSISPAPFSFTVSYRNWQRERCRFSFTGLGLMLRRSSLPLLGLFHTGFVRVDDEFTRRATSGPGVLAWYSGYCWVRITNPRSNTVTQYQRLLEDTRRLDIFYATQFRVKALWQGCLNETVETAKTLLRPLKHRLFPSRNGNGTDDSAISIPEVFERCEHWLREQNHCSSGEFLLPLS